MLGVFGLHPNAAISSDGDPFSANSFIEKTGNMKGTVGDMLDYSRELSEKRIEKTGSDPVKEQFYKDYAAKRKGKKHPDQLKKKFENSRIKIDYDD